MKNSILIFFALLPTVFLTAQFDQYAIGNLGGTGTTADNSVSFVHSIGDLVGTGDARGAMLFNQGFPQHFGCDDCKTIVNTPALATDIDLRLYPNPTNGQIYVAGDITAIAGYQVYSLTGKRLLAGALTDARLDLTALPAGIYAVVFLDDRWQRLLTTRIVRR